ncbi:hypothetical protein HQ489_03570 [Candidatus Woesearchaeota archaeon]|nr:hypothetical protein [Candidatus Woesearchaeota archaeon]
MVFLEDYDQHIERQERTLDDLIDQETARLKRNPTNDLKPQIYRTFERGHIMGIIPVVMVSEEDYSPSDDDFINAATKKINHETFKNNIRNLAISLYQYTTNILTREESLTKKEKDEIESRLKDQWRNISEYYPKINYTETKQFITTLRNHRLIARENAITLIDVLKRTEQKPITTRTIRKEKIKERRFNHPKKDMDQTEDCREYIINVLGLNNEIADQYAPQLKLKTIHHMQHELKTTFGEIYTEIIAENPTILQYVLDTKFTKYITTVQMVQKSIEDQNRTDLNLEDNIAIYANLECILKLKRELYERESINEEGIEENELDITVISLSNYRFLHKNVDSVRERLDSLIETCSVSVDDHEHWDNTKSKSARGRDILRDIAHSYRQLFHELDLPEPWYDLNHGQSTLTIDEEGSKYLRQIRDLAYKRQN